MLRYQYCYIYSMCYIDWQPYKVSIKCCIYYSSRVYSILCWYGNSSHALINAVNFTVLCCGVYSIIGRNGSKIDHTTDKYYRCSFINNLTCSVLIITDGCSIAVTG